MVRLRTTGRVFKWISTIVSLLLLVALLYSSRRVVAWMGPNQTHEFTLRRGVLDYTRSSEERLKDISSVPEPGWSVGSYGGPYPLKWRLTRYSSRLWRGIIIPLWMPLALLAGAAALLWYRDRACFGAAARRWAVRLRPERRKKVTVWIIAAFILTHAVASIFGMIAIGMLHAFFFPGHFPGHSWKWEWLCGVIEWLTLLLFWSAPLWGVLWAWLFVRLRNRLLLAEVGRRCLECGYDLTGNVSGRCSECGVAIPRALIA